MPAEYPRQGFQKRAAFGAALFSLVFLAFPALAERQYVSIVHMFRGVVDFDRKLLETEGGFLEGGNLSDRLCLIAVVRLSKQAEPKPPKPDLAKPKFLQFGGRWKATPRVGAAPTGKDVVSICQVHLRAGGVDDQILNALENPGSYYVTDWTGNVMQIYAPERRLAASIRLIER